MRSDEELVAGIRAGDQDAESEFDQRFRGRVAAIVRRRGVPANDCEDVAQNVLVDAIRQIRQGRFRQAARLSTWLYPIIGGQIANDWRSRDGLETVSLENLKGHSHQLVTASPNDNVVAVQQALTSLPHEEQLLLWLHEVMGHTLEEIGVMIGLRKSAVQVRLVRAQEHFRTAIRDGGKSLPAKRLKEGRTWNA